MLDTTIDYYLILLSTRYFDLKMDKNSGRYLKLCLETYFINSEFTGKKAKGKIKIVAAKSNGEVWIFCSMYNNKRVTYECTIANIDITLR